MSGLRSLQGFVQREGPIRGEPGVERCELCSAPIPSEQHSHVVDLRARRLCCACHPCAILFDQPGSSRGRYRTVPARVLFDPGFALEDAQWSALEVPVRLAFFLYNSTLGRWVASYPSPAGAVESELPVAAWQDIAASNALVAQVQPDVEAVLAYSRKGASRFDCFLVPIDVCYELVATVRRAWRGFAGAGALDEIDAFFARLGARARHFEAAAPGGRR